MQHIFGVRRELSAQEVNQVSGGWFLEKRPPFTTLAVGEEGGIMTTMALGEEGGDRYTTLALGEEGGSY